MIDQAGSWCLCRLHYFQMNWGTSRLNIRFEHLLCEVFPESQFSSPSSMAHLKANYILTTHKLHSSLGQLWLINEYFKKTIKTISFSMGSLEAVGCWRNRTNKGIGELRTFSN